MEQTGTALAAKKLAAMKALGVIPKDKKNEQQGFRFLSDETMTARVQFVLADLGVVLTAPEVLEIVESTGTTAKGGVLRFATIKVRMGLQDTETGETETGIICGSGMDSGDKAIYKALTGARKYFFRLLFGIATGDDPDAGSHPDDMPGAAQHGGKAATKPAGPDYQGMERALADMGVPQPKYKPVFFGMLACSNGQPETAISRIFDMKNAGAAWEDADGALFNLAEKGQAEADRRSAK